MEHSNATKPSFMVKLATVIVDRRNLFFLITIIGLIFSAFSRNWVEVENDLTYYLPDDAETKVALNLMEDQFTTYGTAEVMVANITYQDAKSLADSLGEIKGVQTVDFDETSDHYHNASALFSITFDTDENDNKCLDSLELVKEALSDYDLYVSTDLSNTLQETIDQEVSVIMIYVASIVSILIVLVVLLFTFKSAGMPILLILVIQGSIWINFAIPTFTGKGLFFMSYLVVSSIQMGANIDYAIVIASRYQEMKNTMPHREAMIETLNFAFPTVITSGTILSVVGTLIGQMTSEAAIAGIGQSLGRGTILSMFLVMFVLPQILLIGGGIVDKTSFAVPKVITKAEAHGKVYVNGMVRGEIHGSVHGMMRANVDGDVDLRLLSGGFSEEEKSTPTQSSPSADEEAPQFDVPQPAEAPNLGKEESGVEV